MGCWGTLARGEGLPDSCVACPPHPAPSPPHPSMAAWLSSAPGNVLGFLGTMPKCGEAREDAGLPGEPLLPTAFLG